MKSSRTAVTWKTSLQKQKGIMTEEKIYPKVVILGIGNLLLGDEGIGIHFIQTLDKDYLRHHNAETIDGGLCPEFASLVEDASKLIIVDAVKGGKPPGTTYRLNVDDVTAGLAPANLSLHYANILDSLKLLQKLGKGPQETVILGIEPQNMAWGLKLSAEVQEKLPELQAILSREI
jgi:hydrogenase maturation protease